MRFTPATIAAGAAALLAVALPVVAHHSGAAEFDSTKKIDLTGTVTKMEWVNPHAHFFIDVKGADGKVVNWNLELASPSILIRNGWRKDSLKEGDTVTISGSQARDGLSLSGSRRLLRFRTDAS